MTRYACRYEVVVHSPLPFPHPHHKLRYDAHAHMSTQRGSQLGMLGFICTPVCGSGEARGGRAAIHAELWTVSHSSAHQVCCCREGLIPQRQYTLPYWFACQTARSARHVQGRPCTHIYTISTPCPQVIAKAADGFSAGDIVNKRVRQFQSWSLMPFAAVVGSVYPAAYMRGSRETFGLFPGEMNFPRSFFDMLSSLVASSYSACLCKQ